MTSLLWNYLGFSKTAKAEEITTQRALPALWYRSENLYELERRAIFSARWVLISHKLRFTKTGDWIRYEIAGFPIFLCRNQDSEIEGFHNVCRHRAFPVVTEEKGNNRVFCCKYHGWSYGLKGNLTKAPGFSDTNFNKSQNNLLPIHIHVDVNGFIWANLDAAKEPAIPWAEDFHGVDTQERFNDFNFEDYEFDHTWGMSGDYNWKTLADNYNECYHCPLAHPDTRDLATVEAYQVDTKAGHIQHFAAQAEEQRERSGIKFASTYYFPNACMTVSNNFMYMMRCNPTSAHHCSMEYEVYRHKRATDEDFEKIDSTFKRILGEDKWLCNNAAKNIEAGVFVNGELHPRMEKGPLFFQSRVREILRAHRKREEVLKKEIWPAQQALSGKPSPGGLGDDDDMAFCARLECEKEIAW